MTTALRTIPIAAAVFLAPMASPHGAELFDLTQNCVARFGSDWFGSIRRADEAPLCSRRTAGGLGLEHREMPVGELCASGSVRFTGNGVIFECDSGNSTSPTVSADELKRPPSAKPGPDAAEPVLAPQRGGGNPAGPTVPGNGDGSSSTIDYLQVARTMQRCKAEFGDEWTSMVANDPHFDPLRCVRRSFQSGALSAATGTSLDFCLSRNPGYLARLSDDIEPNIAYEPSRVLGRCEALVLPEPPPCFTFMGQTNCPPPPPRLDPVSFTGADLCPQGRVIFGIIGTPAEGYPARTAGFDCARILEAERAEVVAIDILEDRDGTYVPVPGIDSFGTRLAIEVTFSAEPAADQLMTQLTISDTQGGQTKTAVELSAIASGDRRHVYRSAPFTVWSPLLGALQPPDYSGD